MTEEQWRNRPLKVTVFDQCPCCKQLKQDVKERTYFVMYMQVKTTCCQPCFDDKAKEQYIYC